MDAHHRPKKSLGQNFLMHAKTAERIAMVSGVGDGDTVLEIGPGTGLLTRPLLAQAKKVVAVEADRELVAQLRETFADAIAAKKFVLHEADIREFDPASIKEPYTLVANIPYYITGEIIRTFLSAKHKPQSMTLLVQKEVAERIARSKKESLLSIAVKVFGTPKYEFTVPRGAFRPAPNVDSAVLSIRGITSPFSSSAQEKRFFKVVRAGFAHKRKLLAGNLTAIADRGAILTAFAAVGVAERARAEDLSLESWRALTEKLPT
ncbi:MAG TPA: 16S rRNA (adenine(1518)-N(6)/adenine(1519)-N(6))-dimethyltransferase RsmA [Candidatus Paceibacterota bacterium]|nr:16S rRNA (adenine(1518)-N(6)/adenine(1519)-N(6))-dimethyltransferase RsmA [Candidatus Paceibacterota bacterium]